MRAELNRRYPVPPQTPGEGRGLAPGGTKLPSGVDQDQDFVFPSCTRSSCCTPISVQEEGGHLELQEAITVETHLLLLVCCCWFLQL